MCPYAVDACLVNRTLKRSLEFPLTRIMTNIFETNSKETVNCNSASHP